MSSPRLHMLIRRATGIDLPQAALEAALRRRRKERGIGDAQAYEAEALRNQEEMAALIDLVVVPESWFFRDEDAFHAALRVVREKLAAGARKVRILSIPCAGGEEPYSIAMTLLDAGIAPAMVDIDAADVNLHAVQRARRGLYTRNAFRSRCLNFRERYFSRSGDTYALHAAVREMVSLRCASLLTMEVPAQRYDLIFCRNLLIYFDAATQARAIARLDELLQDDGLLFAGYAETLPFCRHGFMLLQIPRAFALRKKPADQLAQAVLQPLASPRRQRTAPPLSLQEQSGAASPVLPSLEGMLADARALADRGETGTAADAYRACLARFPDSADAHFMLGLLSERGQDDAAAEQYLKRAVYLAPDHYEALCHLVLLAERAGDAASSARYRRRAARVHARNATENDQ